ncbi:hypothetical protein FOQG_18958 [Fusarium oxysporum f. sp. raphani 54005]|uniref:Uncharacterized protein n=1 Tax=Fusarium oxysporum f. sp. raphani 54005 TaxID=1089458 RepID=X0B3I0_FUSOX|nr:hypothetical protein FOQG_18958 [Fusarium oxysporum f. sp. raphani 54005]
MLHRQQAKDIASGSEATRRHHSFNHLAKVIA